MTQNAERTQVPAVPKPPITAGAQVAALVPQTLDEAFRVSQAIAASGLAPRGLEKPEQIMVAIMAGAELGFAPFQSLQSFAVVNGRPTLWGDGLVAVVRRNGCTIREWHEGETAFCEVTRPDTGETIRRQFSQADAAKAGLAGKTGPWQQYPQRMRAMRARAWAVRDGCADMLRGFQIAEEVADYVEVTATRAGPETTGLRARLESRAAASTGFDPAHVARETGAVDPLEGDEIPRFDKDTGEIIEAEVEETREPEPEAERDQPQPEAASEQEQKPAELTLSQLVAAYETRLREAPNTTKLRSIREANVKLRDRVDMCDPERHEELERLFQELESALLQKEADERAAEGAR